MSIMSFANILEAKSMENGVYTCLGYILKACARKWSFHFYRIEGDNAEGGMDNMGFRKVVRR